MNLCREDLLAILIASDNVSLKLKHGRSTDVHEINRSRQKVGEYHTLFSQLTAHPEKFFEYFRMQELTFKYILNLIENRLKKQWCNFHQQRILPEERLMVTLRYLSTGLSFRALAFSFRMGKSTVAGIVKETVEAIWDELYPIHMPMPTSESLKKIAEKFYEIWSFPNVIGCLDGKHIRLNCPANSGSMFYNYKQYFSLVLQALVDADYKYIIIDVGGYGKQSDGGTYLASHLLHFIENKFIKFPEPTFLPHVESKPPMLFLQMRLTHCYHTS